MVNYLGDGREVLVTRAHVPVHQGEVGSGLNCRVVVMCPSSLHPLCSRTERLVHYRARSRDDTCTQLWFHEDPSDEVGAVISRVRSGS